MAEELQTDKCDPAIGYHVVPPGFDVCQCGERKRMNTPPTNEAEPKNIVACARCGGDHFVRFKELTNPMQMGGVTLTHWGLCPTLKEPILMRFVDAPTVDMPLRSETEIPGEE